jgi:hypothetical protein
MKVKDIHKNGTRIGSTQEVNYRLGNYPRRRRPKLIFVVVENGDYEEIRGCRYCTPYSDDKVVCKL